MKKLLFILMAGVLLIFNPPDTNAKDVVDYDIEIQSITHSENEAVDNVEVIDFKANVFSELNQPVSDAYYFSKNTGSYSVFLSDSKVSKSPVKIIGYFSFRNGYFSYGNFSYISI